MRRVRRIFPSAGPDLAEYSYEAQWFGLRAAGVLRDAPGRFEFSDTVSMVSNAPCRPQQCEFRDVVKIEVPCPMCLDPLNRIIFAVRFSLPCRDSTT